MNAVFVPNRVSLGATFQARRTVALTARRAMPIMAAAAPAAAEAKKEALCKLKYVKGSPNKVRRVLDTIRGRSYEEALMILEYMPYRACEPVLKCLMSAAANAKNNMDMKKTDLVVSTAYADMAPVLKRYQPRAQGRGYPIAKGMSHITIHVSPKN